MVLPDVLGHGLDVVFCGTAAGQASARAGAYYAKPGNRFWPALHQAGLTTHQLRPAEFRDVLGYGLGLTDLAKTVAGNDAELEARHLDAESLRAKIVLYRPGIVAFTSKRAAQEYLGGPVGFGLQEAREGDTRLFVLTSPSGLACRYWTLEPWLALARLRESLR